MGSQIHRRGTPMEQVLQRLAAIEAKLDDLKEVVQAMNGSVRAHSDWISRREPTCQMTCSKIAQLTQQPELTEAHFDNRIRDLEHKVWKFAGVASVLVFLATLFSDHLQGILALMRGAK